MRQFIPFEDDWDMLERMYPEGLVPYCCGMACVHDLTGAAGGGPAAKGAAAGAEMPGDGAQGAVVTVIGGSRQLHR